MELRSRTRQPTAVWGWGSGHPTAIWICNCNVTWLMLGWIWFRYLWKTMFWLLATVSFPWWYASINHRNNLNFMFDAMFHFHTHGVVDTLTILDNFYRACKSLYVLRTAGTRAMSDWKSLGGLWLKRLTEKQHASCGLVSDRKWTPMENGPPSLLYGIWTPLQKNVAILIYKIFRFPMGRFFQSKQFYSGLGYLRECL